MRRTIAAFGIAIAIATQGMISANAETLPVPVIEEDQPGWDCATMGNRICGEPAEDPTVCTWDGSAWISAYSVTYGEPCTFGARG